MNLYDLQSALEAFLICLWSLGIFAIISVRH